MWFELLHTAQDIAQACKMQLVELACVLVD